MREVCEAGGSRPVFAEVDVLVAGSGPAGFAAALAAAREGARVLLVERYGYLGGMMTGARVVAVLGMGDGTRAGAVAAGVAADVRARLEPLGGISHTTADGDYWLDPELFKWQAVEMLREVGASVLLHAMVCDPVMEENRVRGAFLETKRGRVAVRAAVTVDATADGDLAFRAGCQYDDETHDVTLGIRVAGVDKEKAAAFAQQHPDEAEAILNTAKSLNNGVLPGSGWFLKNVDVTDPAALTEAEIRFRRDAYASLMYLRQHMPGYEKAVVAETHPQIGVRQSRRIRGEYTLTDADLRASRQFPDGVARLGSFLQGYDLYTVRGLRYDIPYGCLVPQGRDGLLTAGRCISADYLAANTLRLIVPCFATGQAAGVAAALAAREDVEPRALNRETLRAALRRQGVFLG
ncbi:MAG: FAD-dependent oxidoreductase, partial [Armatimonadota bacterium]|nr:FAD-dependent oxidoreductase [Armatimonadota bacterium]